MAPVSLSLNQSDSVTLDGSGNGTLRMSPDEPSMHWLPALISVSASSNNSEATCNIFAGPAPTQNYFVDGTFSGSTGDSTDRITGYDIARSRTPYIWAVWTGGDPGALATMVITGTQEVR